jgi:hypothetical protein
MAMRPEDERYNAIPLLVAARLIMQGELDDNMLPSIQAEFVATYKAAGRSPLTDRPPQSSSP